MVEFITGVAVGAVGVLAIGFISRVRTIYPQRHTAMRNVILLTMAQRQGGVSFRENGPEIPGMHLLVTLGVKMSEYEFRAALRSLVADGYLCRRLVAGGPERHGYERGLYAITPAGARYIVTEIIGAELPAWTVDSNASEVAHGK